MALTIGIYISGTQVVPSLFKLWPWVDLDLLYGVKPGKMLIHMISLSVLKTFAHEFFNDDLSWPWHFYGKVKFAFLAFILQEFMELVEEFCAKVNNTVK